MGSKIVKRPDLSQASAQTLVIGLSSRNLIGFIFMWTHILAFIFRTKRAEGCLETLAAMSSPTKIILLSYWRTPKDLSHYIGSKAHVGWMKFIYRHPNSLNLFNETYAAPISANYINDARGYAATIEQKGTP